MARILITGTSGDIGGAAVFQLAGRGHDVVATARRSEILADLPVAQRRGRSPRLSARVLG
jgi:uncharacterized protein YbjT (DUF2867 family)